MLPQDIVDVADRWWASELGCDASELRPEKPRVQHHGGDLQGYSGIWILLAGAQPVVSMPPDLVRRLEPRACRWSARLVLDTSAFLSELRDISVEKVIGPAFIGYGTASALRLSAAKSARAVGSGDDGAVAKLRDSCSVEEWEHGGSDHRSGTAFGTFNSHGELCSLAAFERWGDRIGHISVVSTPEYRGRGHASAAVAAAATGAMAEGLVPQYRTLASNLPSMSIAQSLGFGQYGFSVAVRVAVGP